MLLVVRVSLDDSRCFRSPALGAWTAVTNELVWITTAGTVSSDTICDLLRQIAALGLSAPVTLVLENVRYQHCRQKRLLAPFVKSGLQSPSLHEP